MLNCTPFWVARWNLVPYYPAPFLPDINHPFVQHIHTAYTSYPFSSGTHSSPFRSSFFPERKSIEKNKILSFPTWPEGENIATNMEKVRLSSDRDGWRIKWQRTGFRYWWLFIPSRLLPGDRQVPIRNESRLLTHPSHLARPVLPWKHISMYAHFFLLLTLRTRATLNSFIPWMFQYLPLPSFSSLEKIVL